MPTRFPDPDDLEDPPSDDARNLATLLGLIALLGAAVGLVFLVAMVIVPPSALFVILAVLAIPLYLALHYIVWGRLMSRVNSDKPPVDPE